MNKQNGQIKTANEKTNGQAVKRMKKSAVILRVLKYLLEHKGLLCLAALLTVLSNLLALVAPELSGRAIDAIVGAGKVDFDTVYLYAGLMIVFYALSAGLSYLLALVMINLSRRVVYTMRRQVFEHLIDLPVGYFDKNQTGDIISRLSYDIDTVNASISNDLMQICAGVITLIGSAVMMIRIKPILMLVFLLTVPCLIFFTAYRVRLVKPLFRARSAELGKLNGYAEEMLSGQKTIRAYGKEDHMISRFDRHNSAAIDAYYKADYHGSVVGPSVNFINNLSLSLISMLGAWLFLAGRLSVGRLSSFILYSRKFSGPINETANIISEIQSATSAAERIFRLLDEQPEDHSVSGKKTIEGFKNELQAANLHFSYVDDTEILHGISFKIPRGSTVALVGPTGSGKSAVINLLMRFYDPDSGDITIDSQSTCKAPLENVRSVFTMVLQETWLFNGTVAENIAYGCTRPVTRAEIQNVAKIVGLSDYIESLPMGYDTLLDENGVNISKGQKQLLANARALLLDSPVLILDEATSNVDSASEKKLQESMKKIMEGKTSFIVAHRLSTVASADMILVMQNGQITECGSHGQLMAMENGFYRSLYNSQFESVISEE